MGRVDRQQRRQRRHLLRRALGDRQLELRRQGLRQRDDQPGPGPELLVPHQRPGRFRALAERRGPGRQLLLVDGEHRRRFDQRRDDERRDDERRNHQRRHHDRRHHRRLRLVRLQGDRHPAELVGRLHRERHRGQHRFQRRQRLEARLHPPLGPDDHQRLERHRDAVLRRRHRLRPVLQRPDPGRRLPVVRLPGQLQRGVRGPDRLHPERNHLLLTAEPARRRPPTGRAAFAFRSRPG
ncbi:hypothetical protein SCOCK_180035 [Actinacidiphila cocklensis]|uniref:Uncharacterized protein n=1 Tax=Actinacidiphila cocklensis TaxID=887465 RepID=A0A9W4DN44_9ACTN|nr:hypothetical protein SCOCK_180035 [Actinacidiphila cocklensis]